MKAATLLCPVVLAASAAAQQNPFFAMNFGLIDSRYASPEAQAGVLRELGYDGGGYLGPVSGIPAALRAMNARGIRLFTAYVPRVSDISIDPDQPRYSPEVAPALETLKGTDTLFVICFVSRRYRPSSPEGDERAVSVAREIAARAESLGVRVAIYPHVGHWSERVEDVVRVARAAARRNLGVAVNLYHWLKTDTRRDLDATAALARPHLFLLTVNGTTAEGSLENLGSGGYDVAEFLRAFRRLGFTGPVGLQCYGIKGDPRDNLRQSMAAWKRIAAEAARGR